MVSTLCSRVMHSLKCHRMEETKSVLPVPFTVNMNSENPITGQNILGLMSHIILNRNICMRQGVTSHRQGMELCLSMKKQSIKKSTVFEIASFYALKVFMPFGNNFASSAGKRAPMKGEMKRNNLPELLGRSSFRKRYK